MLDMPRANKHKKILTTNSLKLNIKEEKLMAIKATFSAILLALITFSLILLTSMTVPSTLVNAKSFEFPSVKPEPNPLKILTPASEYFTFIKTGDTTCHKYTMVDAIVPPHVGPLPHIHHFNDEWFYFPEGGITLEMSSEASPDINLIPGFNAPKQKLHLVKTTRKSLFYGSRFYMHGFFNNTDSPKRVIMVWSPDDENVGMSSYFRAVGQHILSSEIPEVNQKNKELLVSEAPKYGINQSTSPEQYVSGTDYNFPHHANNHKQELVSLLQSGENCSAPK